MGHEVLYSQLDSDILIPKFYDPRILEDVAVVAATHDTTTLRCLQRDGHVAIRAGHEVGKLSYGTGHIPFVRTSDIANWEIKTDPKHTVSAEVYERYAALQDVKPDDILMVRDGTYLIGSIAMVTSDDVPMLYQSHILRIRVHPSAPITPHLLLGVLQSSIVQRQLRSRQFTADIIDSLGNRYLDAVLPIPRTKRLRDQVDESVREIVGSRAKFRDDISIIRQFPTWGASGHYDNPQVSRRALRHGFVIKASQIDGNVLIPKYYDNSIRDAIVRLARTNEFVTIGSLVDDGVLECSTGCEVGKMAYGTGSIPFIRSSDLSNLEIKHDPKHAVSPQIWERFKRAADLQKHDVLFVRDGTYLIGQTAMVVNSDLPSLFAGGLYRFRVIDPSRLDPFLWLAALQTDIVRRQIQARRFTRDIIDTIGKRIFDVQVALPTSREVRREIGGRTRQVVEQRANLRESIAKFSNDSSCTD